MASLEELHDRLTKGQDVLVDLRQMIDRLAGRSSDAQRRRSSSSSFHNDDYDTTNPTPTGDLFLYLDKEASDELVNDIADTLRDAQDEFDLLREDAVDLGVLAAEPASHATTDNDESSETPSPAASGVNRTLRPFRASLRGTSATSAGSGGMSASFTGDDATAVDEQHLKRGVMRLGEGLATARKAFRAAQLAAHRNREAAQRQQHRLILASYIEEEDDDEDGDSEVEGYDDEVEDADAHTHANQKGDRDRSHSRARRPLLSKHTSPTTSAAADVTAALRQTHARIAGEVARSDFAAQTLAESSRALAELGDKYGSGGSTGPGGVGGGDIGASLKSARTLVKGLVAAHKSDTWYLQTALYMVVATMGWLLFRRLLYGPLWLLVWWPVRTVFGTAALVGRAGSSVAGVGSNKHGAGSSAMSRSENRVSASIVTTTSVAAEVHATDPARAASSDSLVDEVGRMVDEAAEAGAAPTGEAGSAADEAVQPNPKKRMWEEPVEAAKHEAELQKERDEKDAKEKDTGKGKGKEPADGERKKDEL
ncbi:syntaxin [Sporothrix brasiliensis 5110]|uniref:Syntaxin n=1 Tax=Sporothrix brasiliensis 5110 TaxID=1398154 RepID=A0A0C2IJV8_9PEZI|nr:syntaxin [Sporothrix brasiliensis 5110]KIH87255.1 syntaxin [Sporothrix brasiliensis 5110]